MTKGHLKDFKLKEEETILTPVEEEEIQVTPQDDSIAETLTDKDLAKKIENIVDEKIALAQTATDNEDEEEEDEEEAKSFGMFPALIIGGVIVVGITALFLQNRPNTDPMQSQTVNEG
jgi:hypothetical protein